MNTLTQENYIGIAMHYYDNVQCNTISEFETDLYRIICVKKLIDKYLSSGKVNLRLLLNHIIVLRNSFNEITFSLIRLRLEDKHFPIIKSILVYLRYIESDDWNDIQEDSNIFNELRKI